MPTIVFSDNVRTSFGTRIHRQSGKEVIGGKYQISNMGPYMMSYNRLKSTVGLGVAKYLQQGRETASCVHKQQISARFSTWLPREYRHRSSRQSRETKISPTDSERQKYLRKRDGRRSKMKLKSYNSDDGKYERLLSLRDSVILLANTYRTSFRSAEDASVDTPSPLDCGRSYEDTLANIILCIDGALINVHKADAPLEWSQILDSEEKFRSTIRALREVVSLSAHLSKSENDEAVADEYCQLCEMTLRRMLSLLSERSMIVESTRKWRSSAINLASLPPSDDARHNLFTVRPWVTSLFSGSSSSVVEPKKASKEKLLTHEDMSLVNLKPLFRALISAIVAPIERHDNLSTIHQVAKKLVRISELQTDADSRSETIMKTLKLLALIGNAESARESHQLFMSLRSGNAGKVGQSYRTALALVLKSFATASKAEKDELVLAKLVRDSVEIFGQGWSTTINKALLPVKMEHACLVLDCLVHAAANSGGHVVIDENAHTIIRSTIGTMDPVQARMEATHFRLVERFCQCLALTGNVENAHIAKEIFEGLVSPLSNESCFPKTNTSNLMLNIEKKLAGGDMSPCDFGFTLFQQMLAQENSFCWPNDATFKTVVSMLKSSKQHDLGERAEALLAMVEARQGWLGDTRSEDRYPYHRILDCFLEAAKKGDSTAEFLRAVKVVDRMERLSSPLLFHPQNIKIPEVPFVYGMVPSPSKRTYRLLLTIFAAGAGICTDQQANAALINTIRTMARLSMLDPLGDRLFMQCVNRLPEESMRQDLKTCAAIQ